MVKSEPKRYHVVEILFAVVVILWRLVAGTPTTWWRDWMLIAGLFWAYTIFKESSPAWPVLAVSVMAYLLCIYLLGQLPHALAVLSLGV